MPVKIGSIREVHQSLKESGYCVTEYSLRCWVKNGLLPAVFCGRKAYISYNAVLALLTQDASIPKEEKTSLSGIRKIG